MEKLETIEMLEKLKEEVTDKYELAQAYMFFESDPHALDEWLELEDEQEPQEASNYKEVVSEAKYNYVWLRDVFGEVAHRAGCAQEGYYFRSYPDNLSIECVFIKEKIDEVISTCVDITASEINKTLDTIIRRINKI